MTIPFKTKIQFPPLARPPSLIASNIASTISGERLSAHLVNASMIAQSVKSPKNNTTHAQSTDGIHIQYLHQQNRLIFYSQHLSTISISGLDCKEPEQHFSFQLAMPQSATKKIAKIIENKYLLELSISPVQGENYQLTFIENDFMLFINTERSAINPAYFKKKISNSQILKQPFEASGWADLMQRNTLTSNKATVIKLAGDPTSKDPGLLFLEFIYQVDNANKTIAES
ncbi:MAG TPA: hypothetical protein VIS54_06950, partial [Psychromonas sp.]